MDSYLAFYTLVISIVRPAIVAAILTGLWVALQRAAQPPRSRVSTWLAVAVPLVAWLALIWTAGSAGFFFKTVEDCEALIGKLLKDDIAVARAQVAARAQALRLFDWTRVLEAYEHELRSRSPGPESVETVPLRPAAGGKQ